MSNLLLDSIQRNLILEGLELFLRELILPIFAQITHRGANSYQKVYGSLLRPLAEILYGISLSLKVSDPQYCSLSIWRRVVRFWVFPGLRLRIQSNTSDASPVRDDTTSGIR